MGLAGSRQEWFQALLLGVGDSSAGADIKPPVFPLKRFHCSLYRFQSVTDMFPHGLFGLMGVSFRDNANQVAMKIRRQTPVRPRVVS